MGLVKGGALQQGCPSPRPVSGPAGAFQPEICTSRVALGSRASVREEARAPRPATEDGISGGKQRVHAGQFHPGDIAVAPRRTKGSDMERLLEKLKQRLRSMGRPDHRPATLARAEVAPPTPRLRTELDPACPSPPRPPGDPSAQAASPQPRVSDASTKRATLARAARRVLQENAPSLWGAVAGGASDLLHGQAADAPSLLSGATLATFSPTPDVPSQRIRAEPAGAPEQSPLAGAPWLGPGAAAPEPPSVDMLGPAPELSSTHDEHYERPF